MTEVQLGLGHLTIPELVLLTGRREIDVRNTITRLGIQTIFRFGEEAIAKSNAARLMTILAHAEPPAVEGSPTSQGDRGDL
jgi:hypothetical protein